MTWDSVGNLVTDVFLLNSIMKFIHESLKKVLTSVKDSWIPRLNLTKIHAIPSHLHL